MNFLIHLYLADHNDDPLIGQLLGDFVKGRRKMERYDKTIQAAILFHRKIDAYSDTHAVTRSSRNCISSQRRRFAGVIVDVCYDHFLSRHWKRFSRETLTAFTKRVYTGLNECKTMLTDRQKFILSRMISHDWLGSYFHLEHIGTALDRIAGRLTHGERFLGSIAEVEANYRRLEKDFSLFFPDLIDFSRSYKQGVVY